MTPLLVIDSLIVLGVCGVILLGWLIISDWPCR